MVATLDALNTWPPAQAARLLDGIYEHSSWVTEAVLAQRPFQSLAQLKHALARVVDAAGPDAQRALICAHPELGGRVAEAGLTPESRQEQGRAGLDQCSPEELARLQALNQAYRERFGFPFVLAVRGPRGDGLRRAEILATLARRLQHPPALEQAECLRQIHRIAELRLQDRFGAVPVLGHELWDWHAALARHSEPEAQARGQLTVTYLSPAHRACAHELAERMRGGGFDHVAIDAVGNVVGLYEGADPGARRLLTGSHYDTVRNAGRFDGRLGILVPMACVRALARAGRRLPFGIEVLGFAEEEGQRFPATFMGSSALTGDFQPAWLTQRDAQGVSLAEVLAQAGLRAEDIAGLRRDPARYLGFVEVHIEQGPVLCEAHLPLGVVSAINGSLRYRAEVRGLASHAGTTPMARRHDAAAAVAELLLYAERRARQDADAVATVGELQVPEGSVNVVPGLCRFSLDLRAPSDAQRDALAHDVLVELQAIAARRGVQATWQETLRAAAAPSDPAWQRRWERAVQALGLPLRRLPSGAGHDAMQLHRVLPQAMLFVRGEHGGISHNPLESSTSDDLQLAAEAFSHLLEQLAAELAAP